MITVTPSAAEQIRQAAAQSNAENMFLRIAARQEADGSIQYGMGFDEQAEEDMLITSEGVSIVMAAMYEPLLKGATIDFVELAPGDFRFIFMNPNDTGGSSCGSSGGSSGGCGGCGGGCA
jgi:iron-sulfur cluster assembly protein